MAFEDFEREDESDIMDELKEPQERRGTNIVHTMTSEEYSEYCKKYKKMEKRICRECGSEMVLRSGQYGSFFGSSKFPNCKYTEGLMRQYYSIFLVMPFFNK